LLFAALGVSVAAVAVIVTGTHCWKAERACTEIHKEQMTLSQRQLFLDVWPKMEALSDINPASPVGPDVIRSVNVLELVALCWEGEMVDSQVISSVFW